MSQSRWTRTWHLTTAQFRAWLCDKGIPCPDCTKRMKEAEEQLGEVYDIVCDAMDPELMGLLSVAGHDPLQQIKDIIENRFCCWGAP